MAIIKHFPKLLHKFDWWLPPILLPDFLIDIASKRLFLLNEIKETGNSLEDAVDNIEDEGIKQTHTFALLTTTLSCLSHSNGPNPHDIHDESGEPDPKRNRRHLIISRIVARLVEQRAPLE